MLVIDNIGELACIPPGPVPGRQMDDVPCLADAAVVVDDGRISWFGPQDDCPALPNCPGLNANGGCVVPGLIDCHTHTVFAGTREEEFVKRIRGTSYARIAEEGGGIRITVEAVRRATVEELVELALPRLRAMLELGVTTVEIKSGYGLTVDDEIKMLAAVRRLGALQPLELVGTYLAAHTTPGEFADRPNAYLDLITGDAVLSRIVNEELAEFCDVFCERGAFDVEQSGRVLERANRHGLRSRIHADQLSQMGATRLAARLHAVSADHLDHTDDEAARAMASADTIGVLLPACSFFLGTTPAPARRLMELDVPVALATDYNPGSAMVLSLPLTMSIACTQMRMTPTEALVACTANAAAALTRQHRLGSIAVGYDADLVILDVARHEQWAYHVGRNCVRTVIKQGKVIWSRPADA